MPSIQVYLPNDLYEAVKERGLPASALLQDAVRAEVRRRQIVTASHSYTAALASQLGEPTARQRARAEALTRRIGARTSQRIGSHGQTAPST